MLCAASTVVSFSIPTRSIHQMSVVVSVRYLFPQHDAAKCEAMGQRQRCRSADNDYWSCRRPHTRIFYMYLYIYLWCMRFGPAEKFQRIKISWTCHPAPPSSIQPPSTSPRHVAVVDTVSKMDFRFPVSVCRSSLLFSMLQHTLSHTHTHTNAQQYPVICTTIFISLLLFFIIVGGGCLGVALVVAHPCIDIWCCPVGCESCES